MIYEYPPLGGGGGIACRHIVNEMASRLPYDITVITAAVGDDTVERESSGAEVIRLRCASRRPHRSSATFLFMLRYVIRASLCAWRLRRAGRTFDLVHTHFVIPTGPAGVAAASIFRAPMVLTLIGGDLLEQPLEQREYQNPIWRLIIRKITMSADVVTAISHDTRRAAERILMPAKRRIEVITLGYSPPQFTEESDQTPRDPAETVQLIAVSRLVPRKGFDLLFRTLAELRDLSWTLRIIGDGPDEGALRRLAAELGIENDISWTGYVPEEKKYHYLQQADLFVLFSHHEGLGLVYFEAMHCSLPIVTSAQGGQTDFLNDPENALLLRTSDSLPQLCATLRPAMSDATWRLRAGRANRQKIETLFTRNIIGEYDRVFREALHGRRKKI
jgi:glycosyltransferase involved in cell wall biosynthesis